MAIRQTLWVLVLLTLAPATIARELHSYAFVGDDATLTVENKRIHLYGVHIPKTGKTCRTFTRPVKCAPNAALSLDFKIQGFVRCRILEKHPDRSVTGRCYYKDEDLSAYLLSQGWALALPDAPFEYKSLERIARHRGMGFWAVPVRIDLIITR